MPDTISNQTESTNGVYAIRANQIEMLSRIPLPPGIPGDGVITIWAAGMGMDGRVNIRGSQGVRITSGPPPLPPTDSSSTMGVEIMTGELDKITIQRGLIEGVDQMIEMTPAGIVIDGGAMPITIKSLTQISLQVCGGLSTLSLGPQGITIQGLLVQIN